MTEHSTLNHHQISRCCTHIAYGEHCQTNCKYCLDQVVVHFPTKKRKLSAFENRLPATCIWLAYIYTYLVFYSKWWLVRIHNTKFVPLHKVAIREWLVWCVWFLFFVVFFIFLSLKYLKRTRINNIPVGIINCAFMNELLYRLNERGRECGFRKKNSNWRKGWMDSSQ